MNALRLIPFPGITIDCLGHYLMGLGLLRAVSKPWPTTRGGWHDDIFWLAVDFEEKEMSEFLAKRWKPTRYTKWWTDDQKADTKARTSKGLWMARSKRSQADIAISDCTVVPSQRNQFNPIFGYGGDIGRRDLANAHKKALSLCGQPKSGLWLESSLYGRETTDAPLLSNGGTWFVYNNKTFNSGLAPSRKGVLSPWSFLLAMEGALLLRGSTSKRLSARARPYAVFPFISEATDPVTPDEVRQKRAGEFWAPVWEQPASLGEVRALFQRGLARIGNRAAVAPHEFAVAAMAAGNDAGIDKFQRFELRQTTSSQVYEALPRQRFGTKDRSSSHLLVELLGPRWFNRLPTDPTGASSKKRFSGLRGPLERLFMAVSEDPENEEAWRELWLGLGKCQNQIDRNRQFREKGAALPWLSHEWLIQAFPPTPPLEIRVASAFAGLGVGSDYPAICNIFGVESIGKNYRFCEPGRPARTVWHDGLPLAALLGFVQRRLIDSEKNLNPLAGQVELSPGDIGAYLDAGSVTLETIQKWVPALSLLDWLKGPRVFPGTTSEKSADANILIWAFFKPFFLSAPLPMGQRNFFRADTETAQPGFARQLFLRLRQGAWTDAITLAIQGYRSQGWSPISPVVPKEVNHERLATALVLPISHQNLFSLITRWLEPSKNNNAPV